MNIMIAGARSQKTLEKDVQERIMNICKQQYDILIGDCYGIDAAVQELLKSMNYRKVTVFATNGITRNNKGNWNVFAVHNNGHSKGFDFYREKDLAMIQAANYGLMIWDEEGKGTLSNMIELAKQNKPTAVYLTKSKKTATITNELSLARLIYSCDPFAQKLYWQLTRQSDKPAQLQQVSRFSTI